ncbi:DUF6503 family protein [Roseivirga misakiensis]|uniref:Uncharacterized protein n=1 Tax=Roseivirga misakiensis TaxID=1563681 RepID=A0A1E5T755_9BACT|nr:DUF6503 family protein [Roseivirga misakiensis]OEK07176.1 hypothetical protein BFP71_05840 [Roseivirga misakiensis]
MKTKYLAILFSAIIIGFAACNPQAENTNEPYGNPPAEGFNLAGSDAKAMAIADEVMEAMGGREAWDNTRHICWNFFGRRELIWDKWTGDVRIDMGTSTYLLNINDDTGKIFQDGTELTLQGDSLQTMVNRGKSIWINDSYWLVMPYKLKDSGVTLTYAGEEATEDGRMADKLNLTFEGVGRTPQNMYYVWVDKESRLVTQWAYYPTTDAEEPRFTNPWKDYQKMGNIMLSGEREMAQLSNIMVFDELPESVYNSADKPSLKPAADSE